MQMNYLIVWIKIFASLIAIAKCDEILNEKLNEENRLEEIPTVTTKTDALAPQEDVNYFPYDDAFAKDAVQQYVTQYGGPFIPGIFGQNMPDFAAGYDGFLVPVVPVQEEETRLDGFSGIGKFLAAMKILFGWIIKAGTIILSGVGIVLFGGLVTTAFCSLTPICAISFGGLSSRELKDAAKLVLGKEITAERVSRAIQFFQTAVDKYSKMQVNPTSTKSKNITKIPRN